jgi:uridine kinase
MSPDALRTATSRIQQALDAHPGRPVLVGLDGRCGSGKTTLAAQLAAAFPACTVLHMDDYYLPPARRIPGWERTPAANMDLVRFYSEALGPARAGQPIHTRAYLCAQGDYGAPRIFAPQPLVLVEGSYALHPQLADAYDCKFFLTCTPETQAARLQAREGAHYAAFVSRWIPLEEAYFSAFHIPASADCVLESL